MDNSFEQRLQISVQKSFWICSKHFEDHNLVKSLFGNIKLLSNAIPSIFTNI